MNRSQIQLHKNRCSLDHGGATPGGDPGGAYSRDSFSAVCPNASANTRALAQHAPPRIRDKTDDSWLSRASSAPRGRYRQHAPRPWAPAVGLRQRHGGVACPVSGPRAHREVNLGGIRQLCAVARGQGMLRPQLLFQPLHQHPRLHRQIAIGRRDRLDVTDYRPSLMHGNR